VKVKISPLLIELLPRIKKEIQEAFKNIPQFHQLPSGVRAGHYWRMRPLSHECQIEVVIPGGLFLLGKR